MKIKVSALIFILGFSYQKLNAQELKYLGHGKIEFQNKVIKKPRKIKEILIAENSPELMSIYREYVVKKRLSQFFIWGQSQFLKIFFDRITSS
jgi:hypothetical protein